MQTQNLIIMLLICVALMLISVLGIMLLEWEVQPEPKTIYTPITKEILIIQEKIITKNTIKKEYDVKQTIDRANQLIKDTGARTWKQQT